MKKIKIFLFSIAVLTLFGQCQAPDNSYAELTGMPVASFQKATAAALAFEQPRNYELPFYLLGPIGHDVTVTITADVLTNAQADSLYPGLQAATEGSEFTIVNNQITIPAGSVEGKIPLLVNFEALEANPLKAVTRLRLTIDGKEDKLVQSTTAVELMNFCPMSTMAGYIGTYVVTNYDPEDNLTTVPGGGTCSITWSEAMGDTLLIQGFTSIIAGDVGAIDIKVVLHYDVEGEYTPEVINTQLLEKDALGAGTGEVWIKNAANFGRFSDCNKTIDILYDPYFVGSTYWFGGHEFRAKFVKQ